MNLIEYEKVKNLSYLDYCDYLQRKYGIGRCNYMTKSWSKNEKVSRTSEGLYVHHKFEDHEICLSEVNIAKENPYEWQMAENLVYCDLLEHLFLHILLIEYFLEEFNNTEFGSGGVFVFLVPELNDVYSGWKTKQSWRKNCHEKIINDKDVYFALIKRLKIIYKEDERIVPRLCHSMNQKYGLWLEFKNSKIYNKIKKL